MSKDYSKLFEPFKHHICFIFRRFSAKTAVFPYFSATFYYTSFLAEYQPEKRKNDRNFTIERAVPPAGGTPPAA